MDLSLNSPFLEAESLNIIVIEGELEYWNACPAEDKLSPSLIGVFFCPAGTMTVNVSIAEVAVFVIPSSFFSTEGLCRFFVKVPRHFNVVSTLHCTRCFAQLHP
jgi:hypothetical protein